MNPMNILLVDDSKSARYALRLQLQRHGAVVDTADSAEAALERIKDTPPDAVFMDHTMPGMNGFEALEILKSTPTTAHIPVVMCTSNEDPEFMAQARHKGAMDILAKSSAQDKLPPLLERLEATLTTPTPVPEAAASPQPQPAVAPSTDAIQEIARQEVDRMLQERLDKDVRAILDPMMAEMEQRLGAALAVQIEERLSTRFQDEAQRLQQDLLASQGEQVQLTADRLIGEHLPPMVQQQVGTVKTEIEQALYARIDQEMNKSTQAVQGLIDTSVDRLTDNPAFLASMLEATSAAATSSAEEVVNREARKIAEITATERAGQVAESLISTARGGQGSMYLLAAGAAAVGIAAATFVYFLLQ